MSVMSVVRPSASVARADARAEARCGTFGRATTTAGRAVGRRRGTFARRGGTGASVAREEGAVVDASSSRARVAVVVRAKSSRDGEEVWGRGGAGTPTRRRDVRARHASCCGGNESTPRSMDVSASLSSDEDEFVSQAGMLATSGGEGQRSAVERALDAVFEATGVRKVADFLYGNAMVAVLALVLFAVGGIAHLGAHGGGAGLVQTSTAAQVSKVCVALVYFLAGTPEFVNLAYDLAAGRVNIHVLTILAVLGTILLGCAMEGALLLVLFAAAHFVENRLTLHARGDLKALWGTVPTTAEMVTMNADGNPDLGSLREVPAADVDVGTMIFVKAGHQVPLDGVVVHGSALVSIQHITGEALPVMKRYGDEIPAGAMNTDGALVVKSLRSSEESTPARIARLTEAAQARRPKVSRLIDAIGDRYSKAILAITFISMIVAPLVLGIPFLGRSGAMYRSFAFLTAAAPCALLMSPLVYVAAIGAMARRGVLIRGGLTLDALAEVGAVALDKTGTITTGQMTCSSITRFENGARRSDVASASPKALAYALSLERGSSHPIATAVTQTARSVDLPDVGAVKDYKLVAGRGVEGTFEGKRARFGSPDFALELCDSGADECSAEVSAKEGEILSVLTIEGENPVLFSFTDTLNPQAPEAVESLRSGKCRRSWWESESKAVGMDVVMLTGDTETSAATMAEAIKIEPKDVHAGLAPSQKLELVETMRERVKSTRYSRVAMVGDGINDAPALAAADVGVAIASTPSDAAASAADVLFLTKDEGGISQLPELFSVAERTRRVLRQNIALAVVSIIGSSVPALFGAFPLWLAVLLHEGSTLMVGMNSVRLLVTFGRQPLSKGTKLALTGFTVFCCLGAAYTMCSEAIAIWISHLHLSHWMNVVTAFKSAWAGLLAGCLHTLTGPDHLAALTPLTVGPSRAQNALMGALWGFGHNTGQILFGCIFILLRDRLPLNMEVIGQFGQGIVGLTLIIIGALGFWEIVGGHSHSHSHSHSHPHSHSHGTDTPVKRDSNFISWTYITGTIHGLQPDSLFLLLPALALPRVEAISFLATFFIGTIISMGTYTYCIGAGAAALEKNNPKFVSYISRGSSAVALGFGVLFVVSAIFGLDLI